MFVWALVSDFINLYLLFDWCIIRAYASLFIILTFYIPGLIFLIPYNGINMSTLYNNLLFIWIARLMFYLKVIGVIWVCYIEYKYKKERKRFLCTPDAGKMLSQ